MPFYTKPQANIYYEVGGDTGPFVVLINGYTRSSTDFRLFRKKLHRAGFRTLALDNRGSGQTEWDGDFTLEDLIEDHFDILDDLDIRSCHLLGISMGGIIAQGMVALRPQPIEKLILISTTNHPIYISEESEKPWGSTLHDVNEKLFHYFGSSFLDSNKMLIAAMAKQIFKNISEGAFLKNASAQRRAIHLYTPPTKPLGPVPTLIIHGEEDKIIPSSAVRLIEEKSPQSKSIILQKKGHLLLAEAPTELMQASLDFLIS